MRVRAHRVLDHVRRQWIGTLALFLALTGGTAYALDGQNTVFSDDIVNGEVKVADIGQGAVATDELANGQVKAADIGDGEVNSSEIANGQVLSADIATGEVRSGNVANDNLTGADLASNSLKGADIDEATLDIGNAARAYARVSSFDCEAPPGACEFSQSKGVSSVTHTGIGAYCVTAPGLDPDETSAALAVDWNGTTAPEGNASAMTAQGGCGATSKGFFAVTQRQPSIAVDQGGGTSNATAVGPAEQSDGIGFTIVIP